MRDYLLSFFLYALPANALGMAIYFAGKKHIQWYKTDYLFIYVPWLSYLLLSALLFGGIDHMSSAGGGISTLVYLQAVGSGVFGGLVPGGRLFTPSASRSRALLSMLVVALGLSILYVLLRLMLFMLVVDLHNSSL